MFIYLYIRLYNASDAFGISNIANVYRVFSKVGKATLNGVICDQSPSYLCQLQGGS